MSTNFLEEEIFSDLDRIVVAIPATSSDVSPLILNAVTIDPNCESESFPSIISFMTDDACSMDKFCPSISCSKSSDCILFPYWVCYYISRKFFRISWPTFVIIDSGWN